MAALSAQTAAALTNALASGYGNAKEILDILGGTDAGNRAITGTLTVTGASTQTGNVAMGGTLSTTGAYTPTGGIVYGSRTIHVGGRAKVGTGAGWVVGAANNVASIGTVAASQTSGTLVVPIEGLNHGDIITGIRVTASINCTTNNASLDAALHTYTVTAGATGTDAAVSNGSIVQILQTGTGALAGTGTNTTPTASTVATGVQHFVILTATTGASCTIELNTVEVIYTPNPAQ